MPRPQHSPPSAPRGLLNIQLDTPPCKEPIQTSAWVPQCRTSLTVCEWIPPDLPRAPCWRDPQPPAREARTNLSCTAFCALHRVSMTHTSPVSCLCELGSRSTLQTQGSHVGKYSCFRRARADKWTRTGTGHHHARTRTNVEGNSKGICILPKPQSLRMSPLPFSTRRASRFRRDTNWALSRANTHECGGKLERNMHLTKAAEPEDEPAIFSSLRLTL